MNKISTYYIRKMDKSLTEEMAATIFYHLELLLPSKIENAKEYKKFCKTERCAIPYTSDALDSILTDQLDEADEYSCYSNAFCDHQGDVFCAVVSRVKEDNKWLEIQVESTLLKQHEFDGPFEAQTAKMARQWVETLGKLMDEYNSKKLS